MVDIDDSFVNDPSTSDQLKYAKLNLDAPVLWALLFEKAWAKVLGGYENTGSIT